MSEYFYKKLSKSLEPPSVFIYTNASHITISDRISLKDQDANVSEEWIDSVVKFYSDFVTLIRPPVIEIEAAQKYEAIWNNVQFDIDQMKTSKLSDETLWTRTMFHTGYT